MRERRYAYHMQRNIRPFVFIVVSIIGVLCAGLAITVYASGCSPFIVASGGTGVCAIQSGTIPYGNGTGKISTTTAATPGQILGFQNGVPAYIASTTYSNGTGISTSFTQGALTITNTGVISLTNGTNINCSGTNPGSCSFSGTLPVTNGGTNTTSFSGNSLVASNAAGTALVATSTQPLYVGSLNATTTATSTFTGGLTVKGSVVTGLKAPGFTMLATTTSIQGTTTISLPSPFVNQTIDKAQCYTDVGTLNIDLYHTTTHLTFFNASTTQGIMTFTTNNTMTAGEKWFVDVGTPASSPTRITCAILKENTSY